MYAIIYIHKKETAPATANKMATRKKGGSMDELEDILKSYLRLHPYEASSLSLLSEEVRRSAPSEIISRKNFVGHITASLFLLTSDKEVLLLQHSGLGRMLQPGGHVEKMDASFLDAALRELEEETGIKRDCISLRDLIPGKSMTPFNIDTHYIPESVKKKEAAHYHHDFQYLAVIDKSVDITIDIHESTDWAWLEWEEFKKIHNFSTQVAKINTLLEKNAQHFFQSVVKPSKT